MVGLGRCGCDSSDKMFYVLTLCSLQGANFFHMNMDGDVMMNMPPGFMCDPTSAIPQQGLHCIDLSTVPATSADWTEPAYVVGSYHNDIAFIEPMVSLFNFAL